MLGWIDVRISFMGNDEMQGVRRKSAVEQVVRCSCVLVSRFSVGIAQRAHDVLFESGPHAVVGHRRAGLKTPWLIGELLGSCRLRQSEQDSAAEKRPPMQQAVAGNDFDVFLHFHRTLHSREKLATKGTEGTKGTYSTKTLVPFVPFVASSFPFIFQMPATHSRAGHCAGPNPNSRKAFHPRLSALRRRARRRGPRDG